MERIERKTLTALLLNSPAWARVGLTVRDERLRERAAEALAETIMEHIDPSPDLRDQLCLPI